MGRYKDITGNKYGKLVAIESVGRSRKGELLWSCKCDCGNIHVVNGVKLRHGKVVSCTKCPIESKNIFNVHPDGYMIGITSKGEEFIFDVVDTKDIKKYTWHIDDKGYPRTTFNKSKIRLHTFILGNKRGLTIDHKDGNTLNNRRDNLRYASRKEQSFNTRSHRDSTSKYKGVCYDKKNNKWHSEICTGGERKFLGYFEKEEDAAQAYNEAVLESRIDFIKLNMV